MPQFVRDERRSYRVHFLVWSLLFTAVTAWAVVDEVWTRRPWKAYQAVYLERTRDAEYVGGIQQIVVPALDVIDRCPTCHAGVNDAPVDAAAGESADPSIARALRPHPDRARLLGKHPPHRFGCTPCHRGQGLALTAGTAHGEEDPHWLDPMLRGPYVEAGCLLCHADEETLEGAPVLSRGRKLFRELGCGGCHGTDWPDPVKRGPSLRKVRAKLHPGYLRQWIRDPKPLRPSRRMPQFWPGADTDLEIATRRDRESLALAAYLLAVSEPYPLADDAPPIDAALAEPGKALFDNVGCRGCHLIGEPEADAVTLGKPPESAGGDAWESFGGDDGFGGDDEDDGDDDEGAGTAEAKPDAGAPAEEAPPRPIDFAPALGKTGARARPGFLFAWLLDPAVYWGHATMPNLRLTPAEAARLTAYLEGLGVDERPEVPEALAGALDPQLVEQGKQLVVTYGCFGCHEIPGFLEEGQPGPELRRYARKDVHEMYFGDLDLAPDEKTWRFYTETKLRAPRAFGTTEIAQVMPDYTLTDEEQTALSVYLYGMRGEAPPAEYVYRDPVAAVLRRGRQIIEEKNCHGCHPFDERRGDVARYYAAPHLAPPTLQEEGYRVQSQWLFGFLLGPTPLRPWLEIRMPTFRLEPDEARTLVELFARLSGKDVPFRRIDRKPITVARAALGEKIFDLMKCRQCHLVDNPDAVEASKLAPDLGLSRQRLDPEWVRAFLVDPGARLPGTTMPQFFPEGQTPYPDLLQGDAGAQMDLLVDHLMNLGLQSVDQISAPRPAKKAAEGE